MEKDNELTIEHESKQSNSASNQKEVEINISAEEDETPSSNNPFEDLPTKAQSEEIEYPLPSPSISEMTPPTPPTTNL